MDLWVKETQDWLNDTYQGVNGWMVVNPDGKTGWQTMYALTKALQVELGITALSNNFGAGTLAALTSQFGDIEYGDHAGDNVIKILQGAMYCKGFNGAGVQHSDGTLSFDGSFGAQLQASVNSLRGNIGLAGIGTVTPKMFKGLLTMDAYVLVAGGSATTRSIQQEMNSRYINRRDFYLIPTDGFFSRGVQNALLYALQYEIGMADGTANGNFGSLTQQGIKDKAILQQGSADTTKFFVHLFQAAMNFNGYATPFDGVFGSSLKSTVQLFQGFAKLTVNGTADYRTWASLLVSTGDPTRPGQAVDCITTITAERAQTLLAHGYKTVGRYLTNTPGGSLDKNIKPGELATIFAAGLTVFPIHQEGGTGTTFFSREQGWAAAERAHNAATGYGFRPGTIIYFAVDFDALDIEITSNIIPHFEGIAQRFTALNSPYQVGVYGARNLCSRVSKEDLAEASFVSGMSTGFSGNLGYPLPKNWAFDQILEYTIGTGAGAIGIDKNIKSGRDLGQYSVTTVTPPPAVNMDFDGYVTWVGGKAHSYKLANPSAPSITQLALSWLRSDDYDDETWDALGGTRPAEWKNYMEDRIAIEGVSKIQFVYDPSTGITFDTNHLFATTNAVHFQGLPAPTRADLSDIGGWAGDLITALIDFKQFAALGESAHTFGMRWLGQKYDSHYSPADWFADIDGYNIAWDLLDNPNLLLATAVNNVYKISGGTSAQRYSQFLNRRFGGQTTSMRTCIDSVFYMDADIEDAGFIAARAFLLLRPFATDGNHYAIGNFTTTELSGMADAFYDLLLQKL